MKSIRMEQSYTHSPETTLTLLASTQLWMEPGATVNVDGDSTHGWTVHVTSPVDEKQVPKQYTKFVPPGVKVVQTITVPPVGKSGVAQYRGHAPGTPAEVSAELRVDPATDGKGSLLTVDARFSVKVPLLGSTLEKKAEPFARNLLKRQFDKLGKL